MDSVRQSWDVSKRFEGQETSCGFILHRSTSHTLTNFSITVCCKTRSLVLCFLIILCITRVHALDDIRRTGSTSVIYDPGHAVSPNYHEEAVRPSDKLNTSDNGETVYDDDYYYYVYDYDYVNATDQIIDQVGRATIRKCNCGVYKYWDEEGGGCYSTTTLEFVNAEALPYHYIVYTYQWKEVVVRDLDCMAPNKKLHLDDGYFILMTDGRLMDYHTGHVHSTDLYCFDHVLNAVGEVILKASVCLPQPSVPFCNPARLDDKTFHSSGGCDDDAHLSLTPPLLVNGMLEVWEVTAVPVVRPTCDAMEELVQVQLDGDEAILIYVGGGHSTSLVWKTRDHVHDKRPDTSFCIKYEGRSTKYEALVCSSDPVKEHESLCANSSCVRKCCDEGQGYNVLSSLCEPLSDAEDEWHPVFEEPSPGYALVTGFPLCQLWLNVTQHRNYMLHHDGTLVLSSTGETYSASEYCLDHMVDIHGGNFSTMLVACLKEKTCPDVSTAKGTLMLISCAFLLMTTGVYVSITELRCLQPSRCLLCYAASLCLGFLCSAIATLAVRQLSRVGCIVTGMTAHFGVLAAFFWSNVMSFDLWWALRRMLPPDESTGKRFKWYCMYGWGSPVLIGSAALVVQLLPDERRYAQLIRPGFGSNSCWFQDYRSSWVYYNGIVLVLLLTNAFLFVHVVIILAKAYKLHAQVLDNSNSTKYRERAWLYLKLFVVMGLAWFNEVVQWYSHACYFGLLVDLLNSLQGVFVFCIFVGKPSTLNLVRRRGSAWIRSRRSRRFRRGDAELNGNPPRKISCTAVTTVTVNECAAAASRVSETPC